MRPATSHDYRRNMNKSDLMQILSQKENLRETMATDVIDLIFDGFADELKKGGRIEIRGFQNLLSGNTSSMSERNPRDRKQS